MVSRLIQFMWRRDDEADCVEVRERSSDYIDGDIDEKAERRVGSHLDKCPPCKAFVNTMRATVDMLRQAAGRKAPNSLRERVLEAVRKESQQ